MAEPSLDQLFWTHLFDLYASEKEVVLSLERLSRAAAGSELQDMLAGYRKEAEGQVERLEQIFERHDPKSVNGSAESDAGAIWWKRYIDPAMLDAGLIIGVRFLAEYKIAAYRAAQRWATLLGYEKMIETLQVSLDEEERACRELIVLGAAIES
jgi:ferritin-like metal-binding protein YciE